MLSSNHHREISGRLNAPFAPRVRGAAPLSAARFGRIPRSTIQAQGPLNLYRRKPSASTNEHRGRDRVGVGEDFREFALRQDRFHHR